MTKICDFCGRVPRTSFSRSHSNIATKRRQNINLQIIRIGGKKLKICTRCKKKMGNKK